MACDRLGSNDTDPTFHAMLAGMTCRIALVLFPGFQQLDIAGPLAAFEVAERHRPGSYAWRFVASTPGAVASSSGLAWPAGPLPRRGSFDMLMLAGGDGVDAASTDSRLLRWLQRSGTAATACASPASAAAACCWPQPGCWTAAPPPRTGAARASSSSSTRRCGCSPTASTRRDGALWTSAGITAGIDLALALVAHDLGDAVAQGGGAAAGGVPPAARRAVAVLVAAGPGTAAGPLCSPCWTMCAATWRSATAWTTWPPRPA
jgi:putative intracellular protease/amidase